MESIKLPIPLKTSSRIYNHIDIEEPRGGTIANTLQVMEKSNSYTGILTWLKSITTGLYNSNEPDSRLDEDSAKEVLRKMPYKSAEYVQMKSVLSINDDDGIDGIYPCPKCKTPHYSTVIYDDDSGEEIEDNRDFFSELKVNYCDGEAEPFSYEFAEPVGIGKGKKKAIEVHHIDIEYPTLDNCIRAFTKIGMSNKAYLQYQIYAESIVRVNGDEPDKRFRHSLGVPLFKNAKLSDNLKIFEMGRKYGIDLNIRKTCSACGHRWQQPVSSENFFLDALRAVS